MIRRRGTIHVDVLVERIGRDRPEHHVVRRVARSRRCVRWRLPVSVSFCGVAAVGASSAGAAEHDVENFQRRDDTGAEEQRQQAADVS